MKNSPCYHCTERHESCHASCERYQAWCAERDAAKQAQRDYERTENYIVHAKRRIRDNAKNGR